MKNVKEWGLKWQCYFKVRELGLQLGGRTLPGKLGLEKKMGERKKGDRRRGMERGTAEEEEKRERGGWKGGGGWEEVGGGGGERAEGGDYWEEGRERERKGQVTGKITKRSKGAPVSGLQKAREHACHSEVAL